MVVCEGGVRTIHYHGMLHEPIHYHGMLHEPIHYHGMLHEPIHYAATAPDHIVLRVTAATLHIAAWR
jgi:hypothetical protein